MKYSIYKSFHGMLTLTSMVCVIGMCWVSFETWWSKIFIWSVLSSALVDTLSPRESTNKHSKK